MMIRTWINRVRASKKWVEALDLASKREFDQALRLVQVIETLDVKTDRSRPSKFDAQLNVLKANLLNNLGRYQEALNLIVDLNSLFKGKTSIEKQYLEGYVSELARFAISRSGVSAPRELDELLRKSLLSIDLESVPRHLKRHFPLPGHPNFERKAGS